MRVDELILVSVDDHVVEPPDMFVEHLPEAYRARDDVPRVVRTAAGDDVWVYDGREFPNIGLNAVAGRPREDFGFDPTSYDEMRPGCWDVDARIGDMSANGVLASMCFPSFPRLCGQVFAEAEDKELAHVLVQAYNDWHVHSWCGKHPGRFIPLGLLPYWDVDLTVAEVKRLKGMGVNAVSFSENPAKLGLPSLHSDHWDPFWAACQDLEIVACLHIGSSSTITVTASDAPFDVTATLQPMNIVAAAADLVWSQVLRKFPRVKIALSEGGVGWLPYFLDKLDLVYRKQSAWTGQDYGDTLPSQVFREQVVTCFLDDRITPEVAERAGTELMTWECDFPHSDSDWPESPEIALAGMDGLDDATINRLTHENAMRIFQFDPYAHRAKDECNVGALRAEAAAAGVDTTLRSMRTREATIGTNAAAQQDLYTPREVVAVLYLHQIHEVPPGSEAKFEEFARDEWLPAVNAHGGTHFAWYGTSTSVARFAHEAITIVAFDDMPAFDQFATTERESAVTRALRERRSSVQTRLLRPIDYDPWTAVGTTIPDGPQEGESVAYMHDFVPPVIGQMRGYVDMMRERYMALSSQELSGIVLRTSWQTVSGGGRLPEMFNLSEIRDVDALVTLLAHEIPREYKQMGTWMWEALATRDQWTTRLARSATWSPVK